ncbi:MAG: hypothetical protein FWC86_05740, partial [Coriobacteriia bacterium]|nr:hypothetical protein [Coriobacteriia bacterium]
LEGSGIAAISAEIDPEDMPQARLNGEIVPFESLIYKVMQSHNQWIVIVGGTLAENTPLPATIEVAVPTGSPVFWFGEVGATGDPTQDPRFPGELEDMRRTEGEFDIYTAIMTTYRDMQIEYRLNQNPFTQGPDGPTVALEYTPWHDVSELRLAAALPPGGAVLAPDIEFMGFGPGETTEERAPAFARLFTDATAGETFSTEITYTVTAGGSAVSNLSDVVVFGLVAVLVLVAGVVFFLFARGMKKNANNDDDYYEEEEEEEDDADVDDETEADEKPTTSPITKH